MSHFWTVYVHENPGIVDWNTGNHFWFFSGDEPGDEAPRFVSPHVNKLMKEEKNHAFARIVALIRLISSIRLLTSVETGLIHPAGSFYYCEGLGERYQEVNWSDEDASILIEELTNPFDQEVINTLQQSDNSSSIVQDYINLAVNDPIVREVLMLLALSYEQPIYLLVNSYKIFENIKNDLNVSVNNGRVIQRDGIPQEIIDSLSTLCGYSQYINSRMASGLLARHGSTNIPAPAQLPSFREIKSSLLLSINDWMNFKCETIYNRRYNRARLIGWSQKTFSRVQPLRDEDFLFDDL